MDFLTKVRQEIKMFEEMKAKRYATMTPEQIIWDKFAGLLNNLSPENISHDGERSAAQVKKARQDIMKRWGELERELGRNVTEDEVYSRVYGNF